MSALRVGARVRFTTDMDRYPHFIVPKGALGTIIACDSGDPETDAEQATIKLDVLLGGAEEWDNCFAWDTSEQGLDYGWIGDRPFVVLP